MQPYNGQIKYRKFNIEKHRSHHKQKKGVNATKIFCNDVFTFDIEVSSAWLKNGKVIPYEKGKEAEYWNNLQPLSLCYIWQFSMEGEVYYGRELSDFKKLLKDIPKDYKCIIWVHNLAYEFQFLCNILTWNIVFAKNSRKPMKAVCKEFPNIEFRCSYYLTRLSLATWGEQLNLPKMVGELDYETIRTPYTELTDNELAYCERDCLVVEKGIKEYLKTYKVPREIPLTQTGTVRKVVKELLTEDANYVKQIKKLVPRSAEEYKMLQQVFAGGYTHANRYWSGNVVEGLIEHYDFASSYPTVMVAEKFPMSPWIYDMNVNGFPDEKTFDKFAYIIRVKFSQLRSTSYNTYIQRSKLLDWLNCTYDNGRVITADEAELLITEQDYITIKNNYTWNEEKTEIIYIYKSVKGYLPRKFVNYVLELYSNKTKLKDVEGKEEIYMQSKQYINSLFGMSVTAIVQADVNYDRYTGEWHTDTLTKRFVEEKLRKLAATYASEKRYFLSYSWGCWVTAYARRNLWKCIEKCDENVLYCDTDSIFVLGEHDFTWYNEEITNKLKKACTENNLDFSKTRPKTVYGEEKPLGIFDKEKSCKEFITLGAKRYVERRVDNKLCLTVSGINKQAVELLNDDIYNFEDGFNFDKDADCVTKRLLTYISDMPTCEWSDGYVSKYKYGINMRRNGYKLTMTDEYKELIDYSNFNADDITEEFINKMKGHFLVD